MSSNAIAAFGVSLTRNGNAIAEITNLSSPELTMDTLDVTHHGSADNFKEYIGGLLDGGEISIEGNFKAGDTNGQVALLTDMLNRTQQSFVLTFPTEITATWSFTALVTKYKAGDFPIDGKVSFTASLKITGKPVLAITASTGLTTFSVSDSAVIIPTPTNSTYEYVATVLTSVDSVTITPTAGGTAPVIKVNGNVVANGEASSAITLGSAGSVTEATIQVTESGMVPVTYTVYIARAAS